MERPEGFHIIIVEFLLRCLCSAGAGVAHPDGETQDEARGRHAVAGSGFRSGGGGLSNNQKKHNEKRCFNKADSVCLPLRSVSVNQTLRGGFLV